MTHNILPGVQGFVDRIVRLHEDRKSLNEDLKEVMKEAKDSGVDAKTLREMVKLAKMDANDRAEAEYLRKQYCEALGF